MSTNANRPPLITGLVIRPTTAAPTCAPTVSPECPATKHVGHQRLHTVAQRILNTAVAQHLTDQPDHRGLQRIPQIVITEQTRSHP